MEDNPCECLELLQGALAWAPECRQYSKDSVDVLELASDDDQPATYCVKHYSAKTIAAAFGPLGLDQTLRFCRRLSALLDKRLCGNPPLILTSPPDDIKAHTTALVLVGAFLVLCQRWSTARVVEVIGRGEAGRKFPCSWASQYCSEAAWQMTVKFCWEGLEMSWKHGWIDANCLNDDDHLIAFCRSYQDLVITYDTSWIVPNKLLVSADPVTTACDPNPETFTELWWSANDSEMSLPVTVQDFVLSDIDADSKVECDKIKHPYSSRLVNFPGSLDRDCRSHTNIDIDLYCQSDIDLYCQSKSRLDGIICEAPKSCAGKHQAKFADGTYDDDERSLCQAWGERPTNQLSEHAYSLMSVHTACKSYVSSLDFTADTVAQSKQSFVAFLKECRVSLVIRCNFSEERGMPVKSYDGFKLEECGIKHQDLRFADLNGALPQQATISRMLGTCTRWLNTGSEGALLFHCKGGFGRSMMLACCWAIYEYDVPGHALLGWVRIARPGAITSTQQEQFLISLKGRADVLHFAGGVSETHRAWIPSKKEVKCRPGCTLQ